MFENTEIQPIKKQRQLGNSEYTKDKAKLLDNLRFSLQIGIVRYFKVQNCIKSPIDKDIRLYRRKQKIQEECLENIT